MTHCCVVTKSWFPSERVAWQHEPWLWVRCFNKRVVTRSTQVCKCLSQRLIDRCSMHSPHYMYSPSGVCLYYIDCLYSVSVRTCKHFIPLQLSTIIIDKEKKKWNPVRASASHLTKSYKETVKQEGSETKIKIAHMNVTWNVINNKYICRNSWQVQWHNVFNAFFFKYILLLHM